MFLKNNLVYVALGTKCLFCYSRLKKMHRNILKKVPSDNLLS